MLRDIKVSIIIPIYNLERYLPRCLESVVNQSYDNYEVLLVDDGSQDGSAKICEYYRKKYSQFFYFYKSNGGLSDARNYALQYITGDYVTFIDGDDYIQIDFLEKMVESLYYDDSNYMADIVVCSIKNEEDMTSTAKDINLRDSIVCLKPEKALSIMCHEKLFGTSACAKLFSRKLIEKYSFPKGKLYEDLATIFYLIGDANSIIYRSTYLYHYVKRHGSIRNSKWNANVYDIMEASENLLSYIEINYPQIINDAIFRYFFSANELYIRAFSEKKYVSIIANTKNILKKRWIYIKHDPSLEFKYRIKFQLMIYSPRLYRILWCILKSYKGV